MSDEKKPELKEPRWINAECAACRSVGGTGRERRYLICPGCLAALAKFFKSGGKIDGELNPSAKALHEECGALHRANVELLDEQERLRKEVGELKDGCKRLLDNLVEAKLAAKRTEAAIRATRTLYLSCIDVLDAIRPVDDDDDPDPPLQSD